MKFSDHLGKGAWAVASRGLPLFYAFSLVMVARNVTLKEFGLLSVFQTFFTMIFSFSDNFALQAIVKFGVEPDVVLEELLTVSGTLFLSFIAICSVVLLALSYPISALEKIPELGSLFPLLIVLALLMMPRVLFSKVLQSKFRIKEIFFIDFAYFGLASVVLFIATMEGKVNSATDVIHITIVCAAISSVVAMVLVRTHIRWRVSWSARMLARIRHFVKYQTLTGVVSVLQQQSDVLIVSAFTGAAGAALYQNAKTLYRGFDVVRDTTVLFVFPASSKYHSRGEFETLRRIVEKAVGFLYLLLVPVSILLCIFSPFIFHTLYGHKYDASINIFRILTGASLFLPLQIILSMTLIGSGKVQDVFRILSITLAINIALSVLFLSIFSVPGAAIAFVLTLGIQAVLYTLAVRSVIPLNPRSIILGAFHDARNYVRLRMRGMGKVR